jgi:crotonobetainyl-CoA:carnitine CoA-transferase CaiB-like acyl-CoA transferase
LTTSHPTDPARGPLRGLRVLDVSTVLAGPLCCQVLGDQGADVLKVEHPDGGDALRGHGPTKDGVPLWWAMLSRNKRSFALLLSDPDGAEIFRRLAATADVIVENFRPGTLERWNLSPDSLLEANPRLIVARISGFGQTGPYARKPGFGTLAEAMSGFAAMTGEPDGPPTLPPVGLADSITGITAAAAISMALYERDARDGQGQILDLSILEPIITALGPQPIIYDQTGELPKRMGNRIESNAPRNTYRTQDGGWVALSTSTQNIAERVMRLVGHPEVIDEAWFQSGQGRADNADLLDGFVAEWIGARDRDEVLAAFEEADAAAAPVYSVDELMADPQIQAIDAITSVDDPTLGPVKMQNLLWRASGTPGEIRHTGRELGADTDELCAELGISGTELADLRERGIVR